MLKAEAPNVNSTVNVHKYVQPGILPRWCHKPSTPGVREDCFAPINSKAMDVRYVQEGGMKERGEDISGPQGFHILGTLTRSFFQQVLGVIMCACIIMHNVIIENECGGSYTTWTTMSTDVATG